MDDIRRGAWKRLASTGKVAASAARLAGRKVLGREGEADKAIGAAIAKELDQMKGMAMKVGQIVSYFDGVLPEAAHEAMRALQRGASALPYERIRGVVESAFGQPLETLFESFEPTPVAAASIGQVHRAKYGGRSVAVKVQYPGIRDTMSADFSRMETLSRVASLASSVDGPALVQELRLRIDEECDYEREASHQREFRAAFAGDPQVWIPAVIAERTRTTVLTTEWIDGVSFYDLRERKNEIALVLARFALRSVYGLGIVNADPHPGNYLFPADGRVVFLDFGCVRRFEPEFLEPQRQLVRTVIDDRRRHFDDALVASGMVAKRDGFDFDHHWRFLRHEYAPYCNERFRFDREWLRTGLALAKPNPNARRMAIPPQWIWLERLTWGLHAVLTRLEAEGRFAEILREALG